MAGLLDSFASAGIDGVFCSPWELEAIRSRHPGLYAVAAAAPGRWREAASAGASAIVIGTPITQAADPAGVARSVLASLAELKRAV